MSQVRVGRRPMGRAGHWEGDLFHVGHVSYVPVPVLTSSVSPSRRHRPLDGEQSADQNLPHAGSFDLCFAQVGHVGNVPHDRGASR